MCSAVFPLRRRLFSQWSQASNCTRLRVWGLEKFSHMRLLGESFSALRQITHFFNPPFDVHGNCLLCGDQFVRSVQANEGWESASQLLFNQSTCHSMHLFSTSVDDDEAAQWMRPCSSCRANNDCVQWVMRAHQRNGSDYGSGERKQRTASIIWSKLDAIDMSTGNHSFSTRKSTPRCWFFI